jgi:hypothetical protein
MRAENGEDNEVEEKVNADDGDECAVGRKNGDSPDNVAVEAANDAVDKRMVVEEKLAVEVRKAVDRRYAKLACKLGHNIAGFGR